MNLPKLRAVMVEQGVSVEALASGIGINKSTLYRKLAGDGDGFTIAEAQSITEVLHLSADEGALIFFAKTVAHDATSKE